MQSVLNAAAAARSVAVSCNTGQSHCMLRARCPRAHPVHDGDSDVIIISYRTVHGLALQYLTASGDHRAADIPSRQQLRSEFTAAGSAENISHDRRVTKPSVSHDLACGSLPRDVTIKLTNVKLSKLSAAKHFLFGLSFLFRRFMPFSYLVFVPWSSKFFLLRPLNTTE